jgi:hypothetical protein
LETIGGEGGPVNLLPQKVRLFSEDLSF